MSLLAELGRHARGPVGAAGLAVDAPDLVGQDLILLFPCRPLDSALTFARMQALALRYELHPDWKEHWHP
ncbi:hypothetical protein GCM10018773_63980 [Streptomyces candidus]|nr:hypothetical protein GCM10018773_63980 [Streptomyces candidus]